VMNVSLCVPVLPRAVLVLRGRKRYRDKLR